MIIALLALALQDAAPMPITVTQQPGGDWAIGLAPFDERLLPLARLVVERKAAEVCGSQSVIWGHLGYTGNIRTQPTQVMDYRQLMRCAPMNAAAFPPAPEGWQPSKADVAGATKAFEAFYVALDAGQYERAAAMFEAQTAAHLDPWIAEERNKHWSLGNGSRKVTGIQWVPNPTGAPHPGVYVRLTFAGDFEGAPVYCGAMTLYRTPGGAFAVAGNREHVLPVGEHPDAARIAEYRANYCE
ncbi:DUF4019 domain-containing protein [Sphingomonas sp.]|uniref:DUF4019 domain-containing protein n=1 Tax=Sphingomonas sp. TaxID=28214 RepID=UPI001B2293C7|nr:DUF4019 domain-containing protein [Sphingomonas sp.]MBO9711957.1 DUF4019 domain-containing protein [Sphingomonas sp.]